MCSMTNLKSLNFLVVTAVLIVFYLETNRTAYGQEGFTNASYQGNYSFVFTVGPNISASTGILTADGMGNLTGSGIFNVALPFGRRNVIKFTFNSTYNVHQDGTADSVGTINFLDENGSVIDVFTSEVDFVITRAEVQENGNKLALETSCIVRKSAPLPGGGLLMGVTKRLPD